MALNRRVLASATTALLTGISFLGISAGTASAATDVTCRTADRTVVNGTPEGTITSWNCSIYQNNGGPYTLRIAQLKRHYYRAAARGFWMYERTEVVTNKTVVCQSYNNNNGKLTFSGCGRAS
ncbi:hypothetical protein GCM10010400_46880 [Streptomyces aculeolatus]|uniref:hypothetical protein n=1 Tax=Streptomyces aculeolatus TaxID=270689 RepID=UPI001CED9B26|nr:hypothetical protein [Streptomyces aculeolatus]